MQFLYCLCTILILWGSGFYYRLNSLILKAAASIPAALSLSSSFAKSLYNKLKALA